MVYDCQFIDNSPYTGYNLFRTPHNAAWNEKKGMEMMSKKMIPCRTCGEEIAANAKVCPHCGAKNKKPIYRRWWLWALVLVAAIAVIGGTGGKDETTNEGPKTAASSDPAPTQAERTEQTAQAEADEPEQDEAEQDESVADDAVVRVGDTVMDGDLSITYAASGEFAEENQFLQPAEGKKYIFLRLAFENTGTSDRTVSALSFECYADGYAADGYYGGEDGLSATLSAGRSTVGNVYFEVPADAENIEVEYETNVFTQKKLRFAFEGDQDSGYQPETSAEASAEAHAVGDVIEEGGMKITYLACAEYQSDNQFLQPKDGYRYVSCEFEFENTGSADETVSAFSFDCYADGAACEQSYVRDDTLSATLSPGRKARGSVTFEVPVGASTVEVEYLAGFWTSSRLVFDANPA